MFYLLDNLFNKEEASVIIKEHCGEGNIGNNEILTSQILLNTPLDILLKKLNIHFKDLKSDIKREMYYDKVIAIKNPNTEGQTHPLHFDQSVSLYPNEVALSAFVSLVYLSGREDFKGGQLYFPFQKKIIEPEVGRMITFPSGPLYPHKILPFQGNPRYLLRIFHIFNSELEIDDREDLTTALQIKQEKKEL